LEKKKKMKISSLYFTTLVFKKLKPIKMSSSMSASSAALGSKLALHKVRILASFYTDVLYSRSREKVSRFHSLKGVKFFSRFFSLFLSLQEGARAEMAEIFQGARGDKNARKRPQTRIFIRAEDQTRFVCSFGSRIGGFARV